MPFERAVVEAPAAGMRLDLFVAQHFGDIAEQYGLSRSRIQKLIADGYVVLNGAPSKPGARLKTDDTVELRTVPGRETCLNPEAIALEVLYEDDDCVVINKAPGIVVHPAAGRWTGTLVNALLHHYPELKGVGVEGRPGIVHRLDKDTSGVMVIATNRRSLLSLARQFKDRTVQKEYLACVWGRPHPSSGVIDRPIGRHRSQRKRMSSVHPQSRTREAITYWKVERSFGIGRGGGNMTWVSLLRLMPRTGRTHQIRVHLADMGYPLIGDSTYGGRAPRGLERRDEPPALASLSRQALHAETLAFDHPDTGRRMTFKAPLWDDMERLLEELTSTSSNVREGLTRKILLNSMRS